MGRWMDGGWHLGGGWWFGWMFVGWLLTVALIAAVVIAAVLLARPRRGGDEPYDGGSARRILEERYARGEIDTEEFERRRAALGG